MARFKYQYYFAYGSNILKARIQDRVPGAKFISTSILEGHSLRFHKNGMDSSAKCDAFFTAINEDWVWGVIYQIEPEQRVYLDKAEGLGKGYELHCKTLETTQGPLPCFYYLCQKNYIKNDLLPFTWYKDLVFEGLKEYGAPRKYMEFVKKHPSIKDPDEKRQKYHLDLILGKQNHEG